MKRVLVLGVLFYSLTAAAEDTVLKLYRPFGDENEHHTPKIIKQMEGQCNGQSQLIKREDAWRCYAEGQFYDPCFIKSGAKQTILLCPTSPWSEDNIQITIKQPINNEAHEPLDMSRTYPWAIELVNGEYCQAVASGGIYDSMPIRYRCRDNHVLMGTIQRCNPVWSTLEKTEQGVVTVELKKVWF